MYSSYRDASHELITGNHGIPQTNLKQLKKAVYRLAEGR